MKTINLHSLKRGLKDAILPTRDDRQGKGIKLNQLIAEFNKQTKINYELLVNNTSDAIIATDDLGRILMWNPRAEQMFGYSQYDALGSIFLDLIISREYIDSYQKALIDIESDYNKQSIIIELKAKKRDGEEFPVELKLTSKKNAEFHTTMLIFRDISKYKRAEEALQESEKNYRELVKHAPAAIYEGDFRTKRFISVNDAMCQMLGYTREELLKMSPFELLDDKSKLIFQERINKSLLGETPDKNVEYVARTKDGNDIFTILNVTFTYENGKPVRATVIGHDITERKRSEEAVRKARDELELRVKERTAELEEKNLKLENEIKERKQAEEKIRDQAVFLDNAREAILAVRTPDHSLMYWNKGAQRLYGWASDEVSGKDPVELFEEDSAQIIDAKRIVLKKGEWIGELYQSTKDGKEIIVESHWTTIYDSEGNPKSILIVNNDITEKKTFEEHLLRAQRMESIGTLAGGMAHNLNNMLTPMMMSLHSLRKKCIDDQSQKLITILEKNSERSADLIKQVLSFSRGVEGERNPLQIKYIISEIEKIVRETFPRNIEIITDIQKDLFTISGDATQLHQVIMNLCVNARDAMPDGGILKISANNFFIDENYTRLYAEAKVGNYVTITIVDSGAGIPDIILERIFEPFFTTKEFGKGTGLGLSTALAIVKSHGGFINVESKMNKGSIFRVFLPATLVEMCSMDEQQSDLPIGKESILVVEDEDSVREVTISILKECGFNAIGAENGAKAVELYVQNKNKIDVVLMDMMMPVMDGEDSIRKIREINPDAKIIIVSGLAEKDKLAKIERTGAQAILPKPYNTNRLLKGIHDVLTE